MRFSTISVLLALSILAAGAAAQPHADWSEPPPAPREFRAAWVATVNNIDWPSRKGLSTARQQAELDAILDRARALRLNAVIFQVRAACDAFYRSRHEPWSEWLTGEQGRAPSPMWDPLQYAIDGCRARSLELHAWFNPFRARHHSAESPLSADHVGRVRGLCVPHDRQLWLDPGLPPAREHTLRVIFDVVERYDIDGIHIDDYFYPYPEGEAADFADGASYRRYRSEGGRLARDDWRRQNVDTLVEQLHRGIKRRKSWVKFGISPFGIARPGVPAGIEAGLDQYAQLYADVARWIREGWFDYLTPQLYWRVAPRAQSYPVLLSWWALQNERAHRRHLWIGNYASQTVRASDPWPASEILEQIRLTRRHPGATGNVHFSMKALQPGTPLGRALEDGPYLDPALVPASTWLDDEAPATPVLDVRGDRRQGLELRWSADADVRWRSVYLRSGGRWRLVQVLPGAVPGLRLTAEDLAGLRVGGFAIAAVDRCGNESARVVRAVR